MIGGPGTDRTVPHDRLARLLADLAVQGVSFRVQDGQIRITGLDRTGWIDDFIERNKADLLVLLGAPEPEPPRIELWENRDHRYNELSPAPSLDRPGSVAMPTSRSELIRKLESFAFD